MAFGDSDLPIFFADFGVSVVFQGQTVNGNLDSPSEGFAFGSGPSTMEEQRYCVSVPYNAFTTIPKAKDAITVNGVSYTVKARHYSQDGSVMSLELQQ